MLYLKICSETEKVRDIDDILAEFQIDDVDAVTETDEKVKIYLFQRTFSNFYKALLQSSSHYCCLNSLLSK